MQQHYIGGWDLFNNYYFCDEDRYMNWYKHKSSDRDELNSKIIRRKFGAVGYGIHISLLEVIAENVKANNLDEWGCVSPKHDTDSLANECSCTIEELNAFFNFVDEKNIYERKNGLLFYPEILNRLDDYAERLKATKKKRKSKYKVGTKSEQVPTVSVLSRTIEEEREQEEEPEVKKEIDELLIFFNQKANKEFRVTDERVKKLAARRKKYSMDEIKIAADALLKSPFHTGQDPKNNPQNTWYATPDFLLRNDEKVDEWFNKNPNRKVAQYDPSTDELYQLIKKS